MDAISDIQASLATITAQRERLAAIQSNPDAPEIIFSHIRNGGSYIDLAEVWQVRYSDLVNWVYIHHAEAYAQALAARDEWTKEKLLTEVRALATMDTSQAYNEDGSLKAIADMPPALAKSLSMIETDDLFSGAGKDRERVGTTKKVKFYNKLEAIKMLGQEAANMFTQKHEVKGKVTLEDIVSGSWPKNTTAT